MEKKRLLRKTIILLNEKFNRRIKNPGRHRKKKKKKKLREKQISGEAKVGFTPETEIPKIQDIII